jgi:hypothetical protein
MLQDGFLAFAQIAGTIGEFNVPWPGRFGRFSLPCCSDIIGCTKLKADVSLSSDALNWVLLTCGILVRCLPTRYASVATRYANVAGFRCGRGGSSLRHFMDLAHHDLILQFLLPMLVRFVTSAPGDSRRSKPRPGTVKTHSDRTCWFAQCELVNCIQYVLACAFVSSPLAGSRILRTLIQAPEDAEVSIVGRCMAGPLPIRGPGCRIYPR